MTEKLNSWPMVIIAGLLLLLSCVGFFMANLDGTAVNPIVTFNKPHRPELPRYSVDTPVCPGGVTHQTTKSSYNRGDVVEVYVNLTKHRNLPAIVQWNLMDARFYPYVARRGVLPVGDQELVVPVEKIPMHIPSGEYYFTGTVTYQVNFLRQLVFTIKTNKFMVE